MKITPRVAFELLRHEALVREAYKDSVGVWTWSVGITSASGHRVERYISNPQPLDTCLHIYLWALESYAETVRRVFRDHPLNEHQFAAALSFHYNTGAITRASWVGHFKRGNMPKARASFLAWNKAGGSVSSGLSRRRREEWSLFASGKWLGTGSVMVYPVNAYHRPIFGKGKLVDVSAIINRIYLEPEKTSWLSEQSSQPSSASEQSKPSPGLWQGLLRLLRRLFSRNS